MYRWLILQYVSWLRFSGTCELVFGLGSCSTLIVTPSLVGHRTLSQWCVLQHQLRPYWRDTGRSLRGSEDGGDSWCNPTHAQRIPNSGWGTRFEAVRRWKTKGSYCSGYPEKPAHTDVRRSYFITGFYHWNGELYLSLICSCSLVVAPTLSGCVDGHKHSIERVLKSSMEPQLLLTPVTVVHFEKFSLKFSNSSFEIHVNLLHP